MPGRGEVGTTKAGMSRRGFKVKQFKVEKPGPGLGFADTKRRGTRSGAVEVG